MTKPLLKNRLDTLRGIEQKMNGKYHADTVKLNIQHSYSNMLEVIEKNEYVVAIAKKAIKNVGLEPVSRPVRGGTDGARLSFMGLPCPNLGTGGYGFHGPFEHISVEGMDTAVFGYQRNRKNHCRIMIGNVFPVYTKKLCHTKISICMTDFYLLNIFFTYTEVFLLL